MVRRKNKECEAKQNQLENMINSLQATLQDMSLQVEEFKDNAVNAERDKDQLINLKLQSMTTERLLKDEIQKLQN